MLKLITDGTIGNTVRNDAYRPTMIRFFHTIAVSSRPVGASLNGVVATARTRGWTCRRERLPAFSANYAALSSNAVSACNTQR